MKNRRKEEISDDSDNPDDDLESSEKNHLEVSKQPHVSLTSDGDSDSVKISSANENSKNKSNRGELLRTTQAGDVGQENSVSSQSTFSLEDLSAEDEVYTFQCPAANNKKYLLNKSIDFTKPNQTVTTEMGVFQFELMNSEEKFITLAIPKKSSGAALINLPLKGHIVFHKVINPPTDNFTIVNVNNKSEIHFPQDIKVRHPLLGIDWQDHLKIAMKAIKKNSSKKHKSIKKEKVSEFEEKGSEIMEEKVTEIKNESKKLKRKKCEDEPSSPYKLRKRNTDDNFKLRS